MSSFLTSMRASVNEESRVESSNFYNIQSPFCVIIAVAHRWCYITFGDSTPDIPGKILLPGPKKVDQSHQTLSRGRRGVWSGDKTTDHPTLYGFGSRDMGVTQYGHL